MTRSTPSSEQSEHRTIWLEPICVDEAGEDRHWCQDDAWGPCEDCGRAPVKYVIASEYASLQSRLSAQDKRVEELEKALRDLQKDRRVALGSTHRKRISALLVDWPNGCHDRDSCARHKSCMYIHCKNNGVDISNNVADLTDGAADE